MNFIIKPTSFLCNMACKYCFYLEKADFMSKKTILRLLCKLKIFTNSWKNEFLIAKIKI